MPLIATRGAASAQGFGEFAQTAAATYIEDVFSTWLYTGNGSGQTITNGINLSGKGGMVWTKTRNATEWNILGDTASNLSVYSNSTSAGGLLYFTANSTGYGLGGNSQSNLNGNTHASWTFRKAEKFFDVVTYTGNGAANRTINHNLKSVPGCIFVKCTSLARSWIVYHRSTSATPQNSALVLNSTNSDIGSGVYWGATPTQPTSTNFTVGNDADVNGNGETYVAYLFAHNAGGFGSAGDQNVISCGSYTGNGSATGPTISLGYEPQWLLIKRATGDTSSWFVFDSMRGMVVGGNDPYLIPNASNAEDNTLDVLSPTATGFQITNSVSGVNANGSTYIYIAIRRGPMKTPTSGTSVFTPVVRTGTNGTTSYSSLPFSPDLVIGKARQNTYSPAPTYTDKLRGTNRQLGSSSTNAESTASDAITGWLNTGYNLGADNSLGNYNFSTTSNNYVTWNFGRAPGFFDVVCYTGTGSARTISHNLGVAPELIIVKSTVALTSETGDWPVYAAPLGATNRMFLNTTDATAASVVYWNNTAPTSSVFTVGSNGRVNESGKTYVAYLFGSVSGVSKVGSYTGTGNSGLQINCGFTNGARFILIKRINGLGSWYVFDTARGIVAGNDARLQFNSIDAEASVDWIDPYSPGFEIASTLDVINTSGGTYLYLAIA